MADIRYQPYYCEENAWFLCQDARIIPALARVVIVTNRMRAVRMFGQRAGFPSAVFWDYHVFVWSPPHVWDPDTLLGFPCRDQDYFQRSFLDVPGANVDSPVGGADFAPIFRVVCAQTYVRQFCSDRSHMITEQGDYSHAPPQWPLLLDGTVPLEDWLDLSNNVLGPWLGLNEMLGTLQTQPARADHLSE